MTCAYGSPVRHVVRSERAVQPNEINMSAGGSGQVQSATAKLLHGPSPEARVTYWNCNGVGNDWDGHSSRKFRLLQQSGNFDAILLTETHISRCIPEGPEWVASAPVIAGDRSAGALI